MKEPKQEKQVITPDMKRNEVKPEKFEPPSQRPKPTPNPPKKK